MRRRQGTERTSSVWTRPIALSIVLATLCLVTGAAPASSPVTLTVDTTSRGYAIPTDFSGLSFETGAERPNNARVAGYLFSPTDTQLVTLIENLGIHNLRMGGGSVDDETPPGTAADGYAGIDNLFAFAEVTDINVIYSLRLLDPAAHPIPNLQRQDAAIAQHIWQYRSHLSAYAIGNEPDWKSYHRTDPQITDYASYLADWRSFAQTILQALPGARFVGPDTGDYTASTYYNGQSWTQRFAADEQNSGRIAAVTQHDYVGAVPGKTTAQQAIDNMLSTNWVTASAIATGPEGSSSYTPYPWLDDHNLAPVAADGVPFRMTEANDYVGGVAGASNAFASALWALDYMHWWAAHGAAGVNFHNKQWILTDTIVPNPYPCVGVCGNFQTAPKGYGIKAFDLGGHGYVAPLTMRNPAGINLTAYAVGAGRELYVTIINKTHGGTGAHDAQVTIRPTGFAAASAAAMILTDGRPGDSALQTATLGGAPITNQGPWLGQWTPLPAETDGEVTLTVPATTAAVVRIQAAGAYAGPIQMDQNGALEVFGTGPGGDVGHDVQTAAGVPDSGLAGWQGWANLPGELHSKGGTAVVRNLNNTLEIFTPTTTGDVYHSVEQGPDGAWSGWQDLGGKGVADLVAAAGPDGSISVFGVGPDGDVWTDAQSAPGVGWSGWTDLGGNRIEPGFVVAQNLDGRLEIFGVGDRSRVWSNTQTSTGTWGGWTALGGDVGPRLGVGRDVDGRLELFGVSKDGTLQHNWQQTPGGTWHGWGTLRGERVEPGFVVGQDSDGRLVVFGVGAGSAHATSAARLSDRPGAPGGVWTVRQETPGGGWGVWTDLGGAGMRPTLVVGNTADGRIQLFGVGGNGDVWSQWQGASGGWSGWSDFGGKGIRFDAAGSASVHA